MTAHEFAAEPNRCPWCGARIYRNSNTCRFCRDLPKLDRLGTAEDEMKDREAERRAVFLRGRGRAA